MSYLVLARKWRPRNFEEVVGQDHVVRTLSHSLDNERLHHAYLFTGTRGVGKTTIARILAKALNCEQGITAKPCNQCDACTGVDQGSYIDLIEVDAASKTKVEDTRALLDNVPYQPTSGRFKIYLFDEIHMLSGHSFNAFLKTLEEPPSHVKFLMATTDPQKLPITVLSRCIQFNLRAMDTEEIGRQLTTILPEEGVAFEPAAINAIARLSQGSMRDALSIVDQAISFAEGNLSEAAVRDMLGMLSYDYISSILFALAERNADEILKIVDKMFERSVNIESALDDLLLQLHQLGLHKAAPKIVESRVDNVEQLQQLSKALSAEEIQLYYQIGLLGKRDLEQAPTPRIGLEMVLLRMMTFHPESQSAGITSAPAPAAGTGTEHATSGSAARRAQPQPASSAEPPPARNINISTAEEWLAFVQSSRSLSGMVKQFANMASFESRDGNKIVLVIPDNAPPSTTRKDNVTNLQNILSKVVGQEIELSIRKGSSDNSSPNDYVARKQRHAVEQAIEQIEQEEIPKMLRQEFDASPDTDSIRLPNHNSGQTG